MWIRTCVVSSLPLSFNFFLFLSVSSLHFFPFLPQKRLLNWAHRERFGIPLLGENYLNASTGHIFTPCFVKNVLIWEPKGIPRALIENKMMIDGEWDRGNPNDMILVD